MPNQRLSEFKKRRAEREAAAAAAAAEEEEARRKQQQEEENNWDSSSSESSLHEDDEEFIQMPKAHPSPTEGETTSYSDEIMELRDHHSSSLGARSMGSQHSSRSISSKNTAARMADIFYDEEGKRFWYDRYGSPVYLDNEPAGSVAGDAFVDEALVGGEALLSQKEVHNIVQDVLYEERKHQRMRRKRCLYATILVVLVTIIIFMAVALSNKNKDIDKLKSKQNTEDSLLLNYEKGPTATPSKMPTSTPTTAAPSAGPSLAPTAPTVTPSHPPTGIPSSSPTSTPSSMPSSAPSSIPTKNPTAIGSEHPTISMQPTGTPTTVGPSPQPTPVPTGVPTAQPTPSPTTPLPTSTPSAVPTATPSAAPTFISVPGGEILVEFDCITLLEQLCPVDTMIEMPDADYYLDTVMTCPFNIPDQTNTEEFRRCACDLDIYNLSEGQEPPEQVFAQFPDRGTTMVTSGDNVPERFDDCQCLLCPEGSPYEIGLKCDTPILGPCRSFDCRGSCNGEEGF